jgi:hypothetical protein
MATLVTLCEAYMSIELHFNLWNYFFHAQLQQGLDVEAVALGIVEMLVQFEPGVDPHFHLPMSDPPVGWQRAWFFLRNNADALLLVFTDSQPVPQPI